jgi:hypothetical protein
MSLARIWALKLVCCSVVSCVASTAPSGGNPPRPEDMAEDKRDSGQGADRSIPKTDLKTDPKTDALSADRPAADSPAASPPLDGPAAAPAPDAPALPADALPTVPDMAGPRDAALEAGPPSSFVPSGYKLKFSDEFDVLSLDPLANKSGRWATYFVGWGVRHLKDNNDSCMKADASYIGSGTEPLGLPLHKLSGAGTLILQAMPIPPERQMYFWNFPTAGGMISSQLSHSQLYGYWEIRAKVKNVSAGHHWSIWLLPSDNKWPPELDILEVIGKDPDCFTMNSHHPAGTKTEGLQTPAPGTFAFCKGMTSFLYQTQTFVRAPGTATAGRPVSADRFYVFGLLWTPSEITFFVDGKMTRKIKNYISTPMYLLITPEVGGHWAGSTGSTTVWPAQLELDYVRIYQKD